MSKGQRGNKEARKPKKLATPVPPAGSALPGLPTLPAPTADRQRRR